MAHANIFPRINSVGEDTRNFYSTSSQEASKDSVMNKKAIETIKLLGQQVLEIKRTIEEQKETINTLKQEVSSLKKKVNETEGNIKLLVIDQKDLTKQVRIIKNSKPIPDREIVAKPATEDFSQRVISNYEPKQVYREQVVSRAQASPDRDMQEAYQTISSAINNARAKLGLDPHSDLPGTIKGQNRNYSDPHTESAKATAKEFVFGRLPRMLDLD